MWVIVAEPFGSDVKAGVTRLEGEDPGSKVVNTNVRRWKVVEKGFGNFEGFLFCIEDFQWE